jgi:hypothetical protein
VLFRSIVKTVGAGAFDGCPNLSDPASAGVRLANTLEGLATYVRTLAGSSFSTMAASCSRTLRRSSFPGATFARLSAQGGVGDHETDITYAEKRSGG